MRVRLRALFEGSRVCFRFPNPVTGNFLSVSVGKIETWQYLFFLPDDTGNLRRDVDTLDFEFRIVEGAVCDGEQYHRYDILRFYYNSELQIDMDQPDRGFAISK